jgi:hypothetical protein
VDVQPVDAFVRLPTPPTLIRPALVIEVVPDGFSHGGEIYADRGYSDAFYETAGPGEILVGTLTEDVGFTLAEPGSTGDMAYFVERTNAQIRLMIVIDGVRVEVSSNSLSVKEMALVAPRRQLRR